MRLIVLAWTLVGYRYGGLGDASIIVAVVDKGGQ